MIIRAIGPFFNKMPTLQNLQEVLMDIRMKRSAHRRVYTFDQNLQHHLFSKEAVVFNNQIRTRVHLLLAVFLVKPRYISFGHVDANTSVQFHQSTSHPSWI